MTRAVGLAAPDGGAPATKAARQSRVTALLERAAKSFRCSLGCSPLRSGE